MSSLEDTSPYPRLGAGLVARPYFNSPLLDSACRPGIQNERTNQLAVGFSALLCIHAPRKQQKRGKVAASVERADVGLGALPHSP